MTRARYPRPLAGAAIPVVCLLAADSAQASMFKDEQWVVAFFAQNAVRNIEAGNEAEIAVMTCPGRIIKCDVDAVIWATTAGQRPISGMLPNTGFGPAPDMRLAVTLQPVGAAAARNPDPVRDHPAQVLARGEPR